MNKKQIDKGFERLAAPLNEEARKDLKKKFATIGKIYESDHVIEEIAYDISKHFLESWKGTGFKAQLAVPKIDTAIKYQKYFESQTNETLKINTRVVFTPPDSRQNNDDVWSESTSESRKYWEQLMQRFNDQEAYENHVIDRFKEKDDIEIIIVVSKLLTGFDAPRNTVLYLAKPLVAHNLLQAIARVNRLFEGKEHGHIIDYVGILGKLDEALTEYSALEDFDEEDLTNAVVDVKEEIRKLPVRHAEVWDIFKGVYNKNDLEALERHIADKDIRDDFYDRVSAFARVLQTALASDEFYAEFNTQQIGFYKSELKKFQSLRLSVQFRYAEKVSYKEEALETYGKSPASKADFIAHQMKKVITENMEKDEAFYKKFSQLIEETIKNFQEGRLTEKEYLESIQKTRTDLVDGYQDGIPERLQNKPRARAFYGALNEVLNKKLDKDVSKKKVAEAGLEIEKIVDQLIITDWKKNVDIQNKMENEIEDYLIGKRTQLGIEISFDEIDSILIKCLRVAKNNF